MIIYTRGKKLKFGIIGIPVAQFDCEDGGREIVAIVPIEGEEDPYCRIWYVGLKFGEWGFDNFDGNFESIYINADMPNLPEDVNYILFGGYGSGDKSALLYSYFKDVIEANRMQAVKTRHQIESAIYEKKIKNANINNFDKSLITKPSPGGGYGVIDLV